MYDLLPPTELTTAVIASPSADPTTRGVSLHYRLGGNDATEQYGRGVNGRGGLQGCEGAAAHNVTIAMDKTVSVFPENKTLSEDTAMKYLVIGKPPATVTPRVESKVVFVLT
ncbi:MAG: hypothetical protein AB7G75_17775 [Candidatus Binatia bacterium]